MEIVTTFVKFRCPKSAMKEQSHNAQIFNFDGKNGEIKIFVPKSKLIIKEDSVSEDFNVCIMPKWAFFKIKKLSFFVEILGETQHMEVVDDID